MRKTNILDTSIKCTEREHYETKEQKKEQKGMIAVIIVVMLAARILAGEAKPEDSDEKEPEEEQQKVIVEQEEARQEEAVEQENAGQQQTVVTQKPVVQEPALPEQEPLPAVNEFDNEQAETVQTPQIGLQAGETSGQYGELLAPILTAWQSGNMESINSLISQMAYHDMAAMPGEGQSYYYGQYDAEGKRSGIGVGVYLADVNCYGAKTPFYYIGEWKNGMRDGQGDWVYHGKYSAAVSGQSYDGTLFFEEIGDYKCGWSAGLPEGSVIYSAGRSNEIMWDGDEWDPPSSESHVLSIVMEGTVVHGRYNKEQRVTLGEVDEQGNNYVDVYEFSYTDGQMNIRKVYDEDYEFYNDDEIDLYVGYGSSVHYLNAGGWESYDGTYYAVGTCQFSHPEGIGEILYDSELLSYTFGIPGFADISRAEDATSFVWSRSGNGYNN